MGTDNLTVGHSNRSSVTRSSPYALTHLWAILLFDFSFFSSPLSNTLHHSLKPQDTVVAESQRDNDALVARGRMRCAGPRLAYIFCVNGCYRGKI